MSKEVYTYTCAQHTLGLFVREVGADEFDSLKLVIRTHFTNCWVKGCQMPLTQVRLVRDGGLADARFSNQKEGKDVSGAGMRRWVEFSIPYRILVVIYWSVMALAAIGYLVGSTR